MIQEAFRNLFKILNVEITLILMNEKLLIKDSQKFLPSNEIREKDAVRSVVLETSIRFIINMALHIEFN